MCPRAAVFPPSTGSQCRYFPIIIQHAGDGAPNYHFFFDAREQASPFKRPSNFITEWPKIMTFSRRHYKGIISSFSRS